MGSPLVSVVMPVYNAAETIEAAVRSILDQTYPQIELIVVDDGSTDLSVAVVGRLNDGRIKILGQAHRGVVDAVRVGCAQSQGAYIARMDADDVAFPGRVAAQVRYLEEHLDIGLVGTHAWFQFMDGHAWQFQPPMDDNTLRRYLLWDNPFVHSSVMFRRTAYEDAGGYVRPELTEDYRLWIRIARSWKVAIIPEVFVIYRMHDRGLSHAVSRTAVLRARLQAQWDAARFLGPWHCAVPALAATCVAYLLTTVSGPVELLVRSLSKRSSMHFRGLRNGS